MYVGACITHSIKNNKPQPTCVRSKYQTGEWPAVATESRSFIDGVNLAHQFSFLFSFQIDYF